MWPTMQIIDHPKQTGNICLRTSSHIQDWAHNRHHTQGLTPCGLGHDNLVARGLIRQCQLAGQLVPLQLQQSALPNALHHEGPQARGRPTTPRATGEPSRDDVGTPTRCTSAVSNSKQQRCRRCWGHMWHTRPLLPMPIWPHTHIATHDRTRKPLDTNCAAPWGNPPAAEQPHNRLGGRTPGDRMAIELELSCPGPRAAKSSLPHKPHVLRPPHGHFHRAPLVRACGPSQTRAPPSKLARPRQAPKPPRPPSRSMVIPHKPKATPTPAQHTSPRRIGWLPACGDNQRITGSKALSR